MKISLDIYTLYNESRVTFMPKVLVYKVALQSEARLDFHLYL